MMFLEMSAARPAQTLGTIHGYKVPPRAVPVDVDRVVNILKNFYERGMPVYRATDRYSRYYRVIADDENKYEMGITSIWTDEEPRNDIEWLVRRAAIRFNSKYRGDRAMIAFPIPPAMYSDIPTALNNLKRNLKNPFYLECAITAIQVSKEHNVPAFDSRFCDYVGLLQRNPTSLKQKSDPSYPSLYIMGVSSKDDTVLDPHIILCHPTSMHCKMLELLEDYA